jgi:hypothetical protein
MFDIIKIAKNKIFEAENLRELDNFVKYEGNNTQFKKYYQERKSKGRLITILLRWILPTYIFQIICSFYGDFINLGIPFVLKETISWFKKFETDESNASTL